MHVYVCVYGCVFACVCELCACVLCVCVCVPTPAWCCANTILIAKPPHAAGRVSACAPRLLRASPALPPSRGRHAAATYIDAPTTLSVRAANLPAPVVRMDRRRYRTERACARAHASPALGLEPASSPWRPCGGGRSLACGGSLSCGGVGGKCLCATNH